MLSWFYQILWQIAPPVIRYYLRRRAQKRVGFAPNMVRTPISKPMLLLAVLFVLIIGFAVYENLSR